MCHTHTSVMFCVCVWDTFYEINISIIIIIIIIIMQANKLWITECRR